MLVDVSTPGPGPFAVTPNGVRDRFGIGSYAVIRTDQPGALPWFVGTKMRDSIAVAAALNAVAKP